MQNSKVKSDGLFLQESLKQILTGDIELQKKQIMSICSWAISRFDAIQNIPEYMVLYRLLMAIMQNLEDKASEKEIQKICVTSLGQILYHLALENFKSCDISVVFSLDVNYPDSYFLPLVTVKKQEEIERHQAENANIKNENTLTIFVTNNTTHLEVTPIWADIIVNTAEISAYVKMVCPKSPFAYDRMLLSSKLEFAKERQDIKIWIAGSSYAMVGINEQQMPHPALNAAVNAQDLYYSLLSARRAIENCSSIQTIVIPMAYYLLFLDMADNPSDYMLSILSCVNYPVFNDLNGYTGELLPQDPQWEKIDPIYDSVLNANVILGDMQKSIMEDLKSLQYYNSKYNVRPEGGMLSYCFRSKTDEQNTRGAGARAAAHNANFDKEIGTRNAIILEKFLYDMEQSGRQIILFTPPLTKFYQKAISPQMKNEYYSLVNPIIEKSSCTFIDLTDSDKFNDTHFQDYDHLNAQGAEVLSSIIAAHCKQ